MSWPAAEPAVSTPSARPRRAVNQRVATTAPSTSAVRPAPTPTMTPHSSVSCQTSAHPKRQREADADQDDRADHDASEAEAVDQARGEGRHQPVDQQPQRHGGGNVLGAPAELAFERQEQHAGQGHRAGGDEREGEDDRQHDPAVMESETRQAPRQPPGQHARSFPAGLWLRADRAARGTEMSADAELVNRSALPPLRRARSPPPGGRSRVPGDGSRADS